jgi:C4-dicarboxylate-specific signal transduction histidine kinase
MHSRSRDEDSRAREVRLVRAIVHEAGNLLAAVRLSGHFLGGELAGDERIGMSRDIELLAGQAGALLAQIRPLLTASTERVRVPTAALLEGIGGVVDGGVAEGRLKVARGRGLADVRVDADAVHQLLVVLVSAALAEGPAESRVQVKAREEGRRVVLSVTDDGTRLEMPSRKGGTSRGRELTLAVADAVLRANGGRLALAKRRRGNQVELWLPAVTAKAPSKAAAKRATKR